MKNSEDISILDLEYFDEVVGSFEPCDINDFLSQISEDIAQDIKIIYEYVEEEEFEKAQRISHKCRGFFQICGANLLSHLLEKFEKCIELEQINDAKAIIARIEPLYEETMILISSELLKNQL